jgi:CDP-glucose 4,6-dehydratase
VEKRQSTVEGLGLSMTFWAGRRVLVTGHTGFKGSWMSEVLLGLGAEVYGLALAPETDPALFDQLGLANRVEHVLGDIRDQSIVRDVMGRAAPDVVFHMAAQPLVRRSYREPVETWATNVIGTAHVLDALPGLEKPCAVVVITTDKVYENREWVHPYREIDPLGGHDPYSASKAGTELVAASWRSAFLSRTPIRLATARAGNVIGGGDWSEDRILPDLARAFGAGGELLVRNRHATRPWQHVLDPIAGYMMLAEALAGPEGARFENGFNFGPEQSDQRSVGELVAASQRHWPGNVDDVTDPDAPHEAGRLSLSIEQARVMLGWQPRWGFEEAVVQTILWYRDVAHGANPSDLVRQQIARFGLSGE